MPLQAAFTKNPYEVSSLSGPNVRDCASTPCFFFFFSPARARARVCVYCRLYTACVCVHSTHLGVKRAARLAPLRLKSEMCKTNERVLNGWSLNHGQGIFEGMKAFRTVDGEVVTFRPDQNAARFAEGAGRMSMPAAGYVPTHPGRRLFTRDAFFLARST